MVTWKAGKPCPIDLKRTLGSAAPRRGRICNDSGGCPATSYQLGKRPGDSETGDEALYTPGMHAKHGYRSIQVGLETFPRGSAPPRHRHLEGYASVVLAGSFVEAGFGGRVKVEPGDVLLHGRFDCHANSSSCSRAVQVLCLPWMDDWVEGHFCITDPDLLARLAERDPRESMVALAENLQVVKTPLQHWTGRLASALRGTPSLSLSRWAGEVGVRPEALSRGFHREFGVSPKQFRLEARARRAWLEILRSPQTLTTIAQDFGFSDLAHLSRSVRSLTGYPPSAWRSGGPDSPLTQFRSS
jgi:AraC-like DNA-binding protein